MRFDNGDGTPVTPLRDRTPYCSVQENDYFIRFVYLNRGSREALGEIAKDVRIAQPHRQRPARAHPL